MEDINKTIQEEAESIITKASINGSVRIEEEDGSYKVHIDTDENALLIGKHGNTLSSLESILSLIIAKKTGEFRRLVVEVGGYRQEREQYLRDLAERLREEVISTGIEKTVRGLKPWERRIIHLELSESGEVTTESMGEDRDRVLVIKKS
jgi:spoIIIJ-associated protein